MKEIAEKSASTLLKELILLVNPTDPAAKYEFLDDTVYTTPLSAAARQQFAELLTFARALQTENSTYETLYHQLLYLYVLNGSRLEQLKSVDRRLRGVVDGQGALLLIGGVSGIGKTSMVMAFQERITRLGARFIIGRCAEQERGAYAVWQAVARAASSAGFSLETLPAPLGQGSEAQSFLHLKQAMANWLKSCAVTQPLVILLDDLHWADVDSLEMLNALTQPTPAPILFIATYRSEEGHLQHAFYDYLPRFQRNRTFDLLQLEALTDSDIERFVTVAHGACTPALVAYLHERAEGHPLFTVGLLDDLVAQNLLVQGADGKWMPPAHSVPVPGMLKQLITQRVSRLGEQVARLLTVAAVAGEMWSLKIVEPLVALSEDDLLNAVDTALQAEIIKFEDAREEIYAFSHGLIREVLYTNQFTRRRKRIHQQIAEAYEQQQPENVVAMAYHAMEGEQWVKAVAFCLTAGEQAAKRYASYSALGWYQQALDAAEWAGDSFDSALLFDIYDRLARTWMALGRRDEAILLYKRTSDLAQKKGDRLAEGYALVKLSVLYTRQFQFDLAEKAAYQALKTAEPTGDSQLMSTVHDNLGGVLLLSGQVEQATNHYTLARQNANLSGDSSQHIDRLRMNAYWATWLGQYPVAEEYARQALKISQQASDPLTLAGAYQNLAFAQIELGQFHEAYQTIQTTLKAIETSGSHHHQEPRLMNLMGYLYLDLGNAREALAWDQKALAAIQATHSNSLEMRRYTLLNIATDYLHLGKPEAVQEAIHQFEAVKEGAEFAYFRYFNRYQLLMCEFLLHQQKFNQAIDLAQEARELAEVHGVLKNIAKSHWFEGQACAALKRFGDAVVHLEKAVEIADGIQHGSLRWKIRLSLAEGLRLAGKSSEEVIRQAREMIEQTIHALSGSPLQEVFLASEWIRQLAKLELNRTPEPLAYPAGLTSREVEVLKLVAQGATNQQVADTLHISVRTVNTHMTNILNKLGLDNRTAASAFAIQHKLA